MISWLFSLQTYINNSSCTYQTCENQTTQLLYRVVAMSSAEHKHLTHWNRETFLVLRSSLILIQFECREQRHPATRLTRSKSCCNTWHIARWLLCFPSSGISLQQVCASVVEYLIFRQRCRCWRLRMWEAQEMPKRHCGQEGNMTISHNLLRWVIVSWQESLEVFNLHLLRSNPSLSLYPFTISLPSFSRKASVQWFCKKEPLYYIDTAALFLPFFKCSIITTLLSFRQSCDEFIYFVGSNSTNNSLWLFVTRYMVTFNDTNMSVSLWKGFPGDIGVPGPNGPPGPKVQLHLSFCPSAHQPVC